MSKGVRTILSVATAIAIPFAAPMIAGSAALAGITGSIGMTASSALAGAGLGAARGAVLGEDIGRSALMGGIGGGVSGYMQAPAAAPANVGPADPGWTSGYDLPMGQAPAGAGGVSGYMQAPAAAPANVGPADPGWTSGYDLPMGQAPAGAGGAPKTFTEALTKRFTDPSRQADLVLRAAGQLAGSAMAGSGLSSEEQALLNEQTEELRQLQQTNQALFNQRLEQAQNLIGESKYFDPEYFGLQSARRAQLAGAQAKRSGLRGLTGDRREAEGRRYDIETGRRAGTAFDTGFQSAISPRIQTQQAGLAGMPGYLSYQTPATSAQLSAQGVARSRRAEDREGIADLFGPLYK